VYASLMYVHEVGCQSSPEPRFGSVAIEDDSWAGLVIMALNKITVIMHERGNAFVPPA